MKRVLSILLVTLLVFSAMSIVAVNATGEPTFTVGSATITPEDTTVSLPVTISNGAEISYYKIKVQYSATDLSFKSITDEKAGGDVTINNQKGVMSVVFADPTVLNGKVATLNFDVLSGAKTSDVTVTYEATVLNLNTFESENVNFTVVPGTVTVNAPQPSAEDAFKQAIAAPMTKAADDDFGSVANFKGLEMLGVQEKADASDIRFVTAVSKDVLNDAGVVDYGYVVAKSSSSYAEAQAKLANLTADTPSRTFTCKDSTCTAAGAYGDGSKEYSYVTFGVNNIPVGKCVLAKFYVKTQYTTTYYYAPYGDAEGVVYTYAS